MDNHPRLLRDHGRFYGIRGKPANPSVVSRNATIVFVDGYGDFPRISKAEIEDRSKGDAISKSVAILQQAGS